MRTKRHWENCKKLPSYHIAQKIAFQLRENIKKDGYDHHGVKVLSKEQSYTYGNKSDAEIVWSEGPENWAVTEDSKVSLLGELYNIGYEVCVESHDGYSLSFYDIKNYQRIENE